MTGKSGNHLSRRLLLGGMLAGTGQVALARAPLSSLRPPARAVAIDQAVTGAGSKLVKAARLTGQVGFVVADARTGDVLDAHNPGLGLPPASVAKALTAQYALDILGPTRTFTTRLVATGPLENGRIEGDLILVGGGDPTLNTTDLAEMALVLQTAGITEVAGKFKVHSHALPAIESIDKRQPEYLGYNPAISGLNLNYNRVHFEWKKSGDSYDVTMEARSERFRPDVTVARMEIVERSSPIYTYEEKNGVDFWTVAKKALGKGGARWLPVRRPELYAAEVFQKLATAKGIKLSRAEISNEPVSGTILAEHKSEPLKLMLQKMFKYSTNLTAEVMGISASVSTGRRVLGLRTSAQAMNLWAKSELGTSDVRFVDHSGLGGASRVSAADMVKALTSVGPNSTLAEILKPIPMRDIKGNVLSKSPVKIQAKTGTLNFVSGLAGFIDSGKGADLAFAIFAADLDRRAEIPDTHRERPRGAKGWNNQAHRLQRVLIDHWVRNYVG